MVVTADIRTAAQRHVNGQVTEYAREWFADGAVWAAARVTPTREQIADELRKHKLVHVPVSRKGAFCTCNSSVTANTDENLEWFEQHRADAVLALLQELAEGDHGSDS